MLAYFEGGAGVGEVEADDVAVYFVGEGGEGCFCGV